MLLVTVEPELLYKIVNLPHKIDTKKKTFSYIKVTLYRFRLKNNRYDSMI